MNFRQVKLTDKEKISSALKLSTDKLISEYDFVTGYVWSKPCEYFIAENNGAIFLYNSYGKNYPFAPPIAHRSTDLTQHIESIVQFTKKQGMSLTIRAIDDEVLARIDPEYLKNFKVTPDRASAEYVYNTRDLIELSATKQLRDKRSRINKFENYNYIFRDYEEKDYEGIISLYSDWKENVSHKASTHELTAIKIALDNYKALGLIAAVIEIDGKIAAFALGSIMFSGYPQVLFEKADVSYYGIYQAINKYFAERYFSQYEFINRQEDLGIEGLRRAKMSYEPAYLINKYIIENKE